MSTEPRVTVPDRAYDDAGVITMGEVIEEHAPAIARARRRYFDELARVTAAEPVAHELLRLATAEMTGCRLCRNQRSAAAAEAGVDEAVIARLRGGEHDTFGERDRTTLLLGERIRAHPGDRAPSGGDGPAPELDELGATAGAAMVLSTTRAVSDGKALVALGFEPKDMAPQVAR
jgi:AhpD family alkylhydroperoxidase